MIERVIERVVSSEFITFPVLASPHKIPIDNSISRFYGSENDVLSRYFKCAKKYNADYIVRITSDCPLVQPFLIDRAIMVGVLGGFDFVTTCPQWVDGLDVEFFPMKVLKWADRNAKDPYDREHVTSFMLKNDYVMKCFLPAEIKLKRKYSVDNMDDLQRVRRIYDLGEQDNLDYGWDGVVCSKLHKDTRRKVQS